MNAHNKQDILSNQQAVSPSPSTLMHSAMATACPPARASPSSLPDWLHERSYDGVHALGACPKAGKVFTCTARGPNHRSLHQCIRLSLLKVLLTTLPKLLALLLLFLGSLEVLLFLIVLALPWG